MLPQIIHYPFPPIAERMLLALALGLVVGLERERRSKEAGLRTFAFVALLGGLGGILGESYTLVTLGLVGILVVFLNLHALHSRQVAELTTSAALLLMALVGVLCGLGHRLTPSALAVVIAALLAWKRPLSGFSQALSETELRSAILLAILAFVIYPALPVGKVDPWNLIDLRGALVIVILIAGIGFANYILLKLYGARGVELTGFLGGLVNSTVTVSEMATRVRETDGALEDVAYRGVLLATSAMLLRNMVLLALVAPQGLLASWLPFSLMLSGGILLALLSRRHPALDSQQPPDLRLESPFSIRSAVQLGLVFVALQVAGTLAQRNLGEAGFYSVSMAGGLLSSSSAVASAASLAAQKTISAWVAGTAAVLASLTSALVGWPIMARLSRSRRLNRRVALSLSLLALLGLLGFAGSAWLPRIIPAAKPPARRPVTSPLLPQPGPPTAAKPPVPAGPPAPGKALAPPKPRPSQPSPHD